MTVSRSLTRPVALFIAIAGTLASIAVIRGLFDPDYFWHVATGRLILETWRIPTTDPFSFTWNGEPWIPDQWLAEVAIAAGERTIGTGAMLAAFGIVAALAPAFVAAAALRSGARVLVVVAATALVTASIIPQATIRPQALSFAFMGLVLALLMRAAPESRYRLWILPVAFLAWANTHGFFVIGLGVGLVYLVATLAGRTAMAPHRTLVIGVALSSLLATMVTPSGPQGVLYALSFADPGDVGAQRIMEWQSPNFHNLQFLPLLVLIGWVLLAGIRRAPGWIVVIGLVGALLGLLAARAVGIGSLMIMPLLTMQAIGVASAADPQDRFRGYMELGAATAIAVVLVAAAFLRGPVTVDPRRVPTAATDVLRERAPASRVLATYEWGGYLINELHDSGGTVFVDGRMHKYQPQVMADYLAIVDADSGWQRLMDAYDPDVLLLSPDATVVKGPAQDAGWCEAYRDERQVLLLRDCGTEAG
jgi:hypothetical protein